jgi:hypothetical protein
VDYYARIDIMILSDIVFSRKNGEKKRNIMFPEREDKI